MLIECSYYLTPVTVTDDFKCEHCDICDLCPDNNWFNFDDEGDDFEDV